MSGKGKVFWSSVRRHYEKNLGSVNDICAMFDISRASLYYQRRKGGWARRQTKVGDVHKRGAGIENDPKNEVTQLSTRVNSGLQNLDDKAEISDKRKSDARQVKSDQNSENKEFGGSPGTGGADELSVGMRLFEVLEIKLAEIEDRIARGEQLSVEENEREQRVIGNLIRNFDKLTEFNERRDRGRVKTGQRGAGAAGEEDHAADLSKLNAVQFREEIARRIEHFEKERKP